MVLAVFVAAAAVATWGAVQRRMWRGCDRKEPLR